MNFRWDRLALIVGTIAVIIIFGKQIGNKLEHIGESIARNAPKMPETTITQKTDEPVKKVQSPAEFKNDILKACLEMNNNDVNDQNMCRHIWGGY